MLPGEDEYFECFNCGQVISRPTLLSGNTFGARLFSDGKRIASMLPDFPGITSCPKCKAIFWLDEKNRIDPNCRVAELATNNLSRGYHLKESHLL